MMQYSSVFTMCIDDDTLVTARLLGDMHSRMTFTKGHKRKEGRSAHGSPNINT